MKRDRLFALKLIRILFIFIFLSKTEGLSQWINHHNPIFPGLIPKPAVGIPFQDFNFKTKIIRLTDARSLNIPGIIPQYSKRQAWNSNETFLMLQTGDGIFRLYNGDEPYQFIKVLDGVIGDDVFWHPTIPNKIIFNPFNKLCEYDINTDQITLIRSFSNYLYANTRGEGNLSNDGRYYAFLGRYSDTTYDALHVYDLQADSIISTLILPPNITDIDWVSISPLGNYVLVDYADNIQGRYHGIEVYDRNFNFIWQKGLGAGHSDLFVDENGNEFLIMDFYSSDTNVVFIKRINLSNGLEITLLTLSYYFDLHISCRNELQKKYCFVSTFDYVNRLIADSTNWLPFENEIFALKIDGSGKVARIAHHRSRRFSPLTPDPDNSVYWAEPHATVSRKGTRIIWGSNWEQNVNSDTSCDTYICDFRNFPPLLTDDNAINLYNFNLLQNYPNPFNSTTTISFTLAKDGLTTLKIYDILGREVQTLVNEELEAGKVHRVQFDGSGLTSGVYFYKLEGRNKSITKKFVLMK